MMWPVTFSQALTKTFGIIFLVKMANNMGTPILKREKKMSKHLIISCCVFVLQ